MKLIKIELGKKKKFIIVFIKQELSGDWSNSTLMDLSTKEEIFGGH